MNRSNATTLVWRIEPGDQPVPFEMTARIEVPGHYGRSHIEELELTLTVVSRLTAWLRADQSTAPPPPTRRRLEVAEWAALLDSVAATLASPEVVGPVADLADVDPITILQPRVVHVVSGPPMPDLLPPLSPIRDSGESHGTHMLADPVLDLSRPCGARRAGQPVAQPDGKRRRVARHGTAGRQDAQPRGTDKIKEGIGKRLYCSDQRDTPAFGMLSRRGSTAWTKRSRSGPADSACS